MYSKWGMIITWWGMIITWWLRWISMGRIFPRDFWLLPQDKGSGSLCMYELKRYWENRNKCGVPMLYHWKLKSLTFIDIFDQFYLPFGSSWPGSFIFAIYCVSRYTRQYYTKIKLQSIMELFAFLDLNSSMLNIPF